MVEAVRRLPAGTLPRTPQPECGSYHSWPKPRDFEAPTSRPARWAFHFIRGVAEWGAVAIAAGGRQFLTRRALGYDAEAALSRPFERAADRVRIQFTPGVLEVIVDER
jgi:hypothetical protein